MSQISPPIRILIVCAVAFLAAWMLFLRPSADAGAPAEEAPVPTASQPVDAGGEQAESLAGKAVEKANEATADAAQPVEGAPAKLDKKQAVEGGLPLRVLRALGDEKVVVILFWQPKAAEDKAVRKALTGIDRHHNKVLAHATHIKRVASYQQITRGAEVEQSPTVVVIDRNRQVESLVGYVDRQTIDQAVTDALRNSRKK